jgi:hypothetical protein
MLLAGQSEGNRLQTRPRHIDPAHQHLLDRDVSDQQGGDGRSRLADLDLPASLLPDVQEYLLEFFHEAITQGTMDRRPAYITAILP